MLAPSPSVRMQQLVDALVEAREGAERARRIVGDLAAFSRRQHLELAVGPVDINGAVETAVSMTRAELRHRAVLRRDFGRVGFAAAEETVVVQAFVNFITNAAHAIEPGAMAQNEICVSTRKEGAEVVVEFQDTGAGINASDLDRVYDPFFTTKPPGLGTGLGLAISYGIAERLGGSLSIDSEVGKGTTVTMRLPAMDETSSGKAPLDVDDHAAPPETKRGRVLVVDDDQLVAKAIGRMLTAYDVTIANCGTDALQLAASIEFDAVICDVMMPEMTGREFHQKLLEQNPSLGRRLAFVTGGALTPELRSFLQSVECPTLPKPFDAQNLRAVLQGLISAGDD